MIAENNLFAHGFRFKVSTENLPEPPSDFVDPWLESKTVLGLDRPILVFTDLVKSFGDELAQIISQIHYLSHITYKKLDAKHFREGVVWIYKSITEMLKEYFVGWSRSKATRHISRLVHLGILRVRQFGARQGYQDNWYHLNTKVVDALRDFDRESLKENLGKDKHGRRLHITKEVQDNAMKAHLQAKLDSGELEPSDFGDLPSWVILTQCTESKRVNVSIDYLSKTTKEKEIKNKGPGEPATVVSEIASLKEEKTGNGEGNLVNPVETQVVTLESNTQSTLEAKQVELVVKHEVPKPKLKAKSNDSTPIAEKEGTKLESEGERKEETPPPTPSPLPRPILKHEKDECLPSPEPHSLYPRLLPDGFVKLPTGVGATLARFIAERMTQYCLAHLEECLVCNESVYEDEECEVLYSDEYKHPQIEVRPPYAGEEYEWEDEVLEKSGGYALRRLRNRLIAMGRLTADEFNSCLLGWFRKAQEFLEYEDAYDRFKNMSLVKALGVAGTPIDWLEPDRCELFEIEEDAE